MRRCAAAVPVLFTLAAAVLPAGVMAQQGRPGGGRQGGPRPVMGRVTAKGDTTLDVQRMRRGEAGETVKVTLEQDARVSRLEMGAAADLTEGYLVVVAGDRDGAKMAAKGIVRLSKIEEKPNPEEVRAGYMLGMFLNRMTGRMPQRGQGQGPGGFAAMMPIVGKLVSTQPLTIETIAIRPDQQAEKVEIQTAEGTRILRHQPSKLDEVKVDSNVLVVPKEGSEGQAVTARAVIQLPQLGGGAAGRK